jgi:hypothetical protein
MEQKPPGRLVLLYFGNPDDAERFVHNTPERVVGVYEDPKGKSCTCRSQQGNRTKEFGTGQHHPYWGWQRHSHCGKAGTWWRRNYGRRLFLALGVNLLMEKAPKIFQSPQGWGHEAHKPADGEI